MLFRREGGGDSECTPLVSFDAGATWRRGALRKREGVTGGGDPWVVFDSVERPFFHVFMARALEPASERVVLVCIDLLMAASRGTVRRCFRGVRTTDQSL